jgi:Cd2+/Zn2+-exporting ATPase
MTTAENANPEVDAELRRRLALVLVGGALLLASGVLLWARPAQREIASFAAMAGAIVVALPIMVDAAKSIRARGFAATKFYMDQYITLAVLACLAAGQYVTGGIVAIILVVGQVLEERSVLGMREALDKLGQYSKTRARRWRDGVEEEVDAAELLPGDRVRVRPGDTVPADGCVLLGVSSINQANITGESMPAEVEPGSEVFAGTSNLTGAFEFEVKEAGDRTLLGRVRHIIEEAATTEAPIMRLAEEYARYYTPLVLIIAAFVLFFTRDLNRAISVIIVSIPCAFVLASPSAMVAALATASRMGILVKSARFFEVADEIDTVVFDKTGTLTEGKLEVERIDVREGYDRAQALALAAALEQRSSHPIAPRRLRRCRCRGSSNRGAPRAARTARSRPFRHR